MVALEHIRAGPLRGLMMGSIRSTREGEWLTASPGVARLAQEMIGYDDPLAAHWLLRVSLRCGTGQPRTAKSSTRL